MATTFKNFLSNDIANTRTLLHEAIPITGSIVSGTYNQGGVDALGSERNIKTYGHGMFESVYDYPYLSSSANHIFDLTVGYASNSNLSSSANTQNSKKINMYNQMAQYLVGYDETGSIKKFTIPTTGDVMKECFFVPFSRLLVKDEIKKGSFAMELAVSASYPITGAADLMSKRIRIADNSGSNGYNVDSPAGEYGVLFASSSDGVTTSGPLNTHGALLVGETLGDATTNPPCGLVYYQAGVAVISGSVFWVGGGDAGILSSSVGVDSGDPDAVAMTTGVEMGVDYGPVGLNSTTGSTISTTCDTIRTRLYNIAFNNTTELNSTIYFCRVNHNDFNYSSNPTYLTGSKLRVKTTSADSPVTYITTVGLYSADNELLAVAKLSEPLRKAPDTEFTLRVRLDY